MLWRVGFVLFCGSNAFGGLPSFFPVVSIFVLLCIREKYLYIAKEQGVYIMYYYYFLFSRKRKGKERRIFDEQG